MRAQIITTGFKLGLAPALEDEFPSAERKGCFFQFCRALYRKIQSRGHQEFYQNDSDVRCLVRPVVALAFLPIDQLVASFELLEEEQEQNFEKTW